ncbi:Guanine nucleotide-binding protein alpha-1 subunit [Grifola frondosa]|uniref:Guanine nucleotide-binding protein alpha-1 subunit n=1 Tax=Grifola frondosa TaxID=5627 RepID=A0A1C7MD40_GRIFR|nr:Guanine nucleotide-binding protein alpha-1 subunit [Grifola frondosa]
METPMSEKTQVDFSQADMTPDKFSRDEEAGSRISSIHSGEEGVVPEEMIYPDGGRGWIVVLGCVIFSAATVGWGKHGWYGNDFGRDHFWKIRRPLPFLAVGAILWVTSMLASAFCTEIWQFFITQGLVQGISGALVFPLIVALPAQWFLKYRAFATGMVVAGSSLGGALSCLIVRSLLSVAGLRKSFAIISAIDASMLFMAFFMIKERRPASARCHKIIWYDRTFFGDPVFWSLGSCFFFTVFGYLSPIFYLPTFTSEKIPGLSDLLSTLPLVILNFSAAIGRTSVGFVADRIGPLNALFIVTTMSGLTQLLMWTFISTYAGIMAFAVMYGFFCGCFLSLSPAVAAQLFGSDRLGGLSGLLLLFNLPGNAAGAPIGGAILNRWFLVAALRPLQETAEDSGCVLMLPEPACAETLLVSMGRSLDEDPLTILLAPPVNETPEQKEIRLKVEAEARQVSERIDEQLKAERAAQKKNRFIKVLLLGQSESGKSTTLKNFQLTYAQDAWAAERESWRMVIQLNLIRNVNTILDLLAEEMSGKATMATDDSDISDDEVDPQSVTNNALHFTGRHRLLKLRLAPLRRVQQDLELRIGLSASDEAYSSPPSSPVIGQKERRHQEFFVRSTSGWKGQTHNRRLSELGGRKSKEALNRETIEIIAGCADDMKAIWEDISIRDMLHRRGIRMEATPGFFLNDIDRIATRHYEPSDGDIVRARLRTLGVQEYKIKFDKGSAAGSEWCLYDVGGSRTQRPAWYPYFDDCDAIIFVAPISCFDERLAEDRRINRLEDSFMLWKAVISSKLLAKTSIILFLNKCDLLERKLNSGVRVKDFVRSFGDRQNDIDTVTKYFAQHFRDILRKYSPEPRPFRVHMTSVVDTEATAVTLGVVEEGILREHLRRADLL